MIINDFSTEKSILTKFLKELRSNTIQKDSMRFRRNLERIGEVLSYEMSKQLEYSKQDVETPLGIKKMDIQTEQPVLCSILRAGMPMHNGVLNYFDTAENCLISAYRKHHQHNKEEFDIVVEYIAAPSIEGKTIVMIDPMLASGASMYATYKALLKHGTPKAIHILSVIGSTQGIDFIKSKFPKNTTLWIATVDDTLNENGYIIPGLGDAGDLAYGNKL